MANPSGQGEDGARECIEAERRRQVESEGWSTEHDDQHRDGELMDAGMCYYLHATDGASYRDVREMRPPCPECGQSRGFVVTGQVPLSWPWENCWWKPDGGKARNLEKAGALMLAEKDRLHRRGLSHGHVDHKLNLVIKALASLQSDEAHP